MTRGRPSFAHASPSRSTRAARAGWSLVTPSPVRPCSRASYTGLASMWLPGSASVPRYPACRVLIHGPADPTPGGPTTVTGSPPLALPDAAPGRPVHQRCGTGDAGTATPWPTLGRGARRGAGHCGRHGDPLGVLRFDFSGDSENLRHVRWDEWFGTFDARELDCLYREQRKDGLQSTFFRLESPD